MSTHDPADPTPPGRGADDPSSSRPAERHGSGFDDRGKVKHSRVSALWIGIIAAALLSILVLVFILQNSDDVLIQFLWMEGRVPTGVAILLAAVLGILIVAIPGSIRIAQLRRSLTRNEKRRH